MKLSIILSMIMVFGLSANAAFANGGNINDQSAVILNKTNQVSVALDHSGRAHWTVAGMGYIAQGSNIIFDPSKSGNSQVSLHFFESPMDAMTGACLKIIFQASGTRNFRGVGSYNYMIDRFNPKMGSATVDLDRFLECR